MNSKGAINQVFVYILSIFMILFVGFLVTKFVFTFTGDVESSQEVKFFNEFTEVYSSVYREWGSEKVQIFRLTSNVEYICFMQSTCSNNIEYGVNVDELNALVDAGDNAALFSDEGVISSQNVGDFNVENGCSCFKTSDKKVNLLIENRRNQVYVSENQ